MNRAFQRRAAPAAPGAERSAGFNLIETTVSMAIILTILLGVMATISSASLAKTNSNESVSSQFLLHQTVEELKNNSFSELLGFDGQYVTSGTNRADIRVGWVTPELIRLQVDVTSTAFPDVTSSAVFLLADTEN